MMLRELERARERLSIALCGAEVSDFMFEEITLFLRKVDLFVAKEKALCSRLVGRLLDTTNSLN